MAGILKVGGVPLATHTGVEGAGKVTLSDTVIHGPSMIDVYFNNSDLNSYQCIKTLNKLTNFKKLLFLWFVLFFKKH